MCVYIYIKEKQSFSFVSYEMLKVKSQAVQLIWDFLDINKKTKTTGKWREKVMCMQCHKWVKKPEIIIVHRNRNPYSSLQTVSFQRFSTQVRLRCRCGLHSLLYKTTSHKWWRPYSHKPTTNSLRPLSFLSLWVST